MEPTGPEAPVEIGDFLFDPATGETRPRDPAEGGEAVRLAPQPAKLLRLLIAKQGALATREEIRERLWPDSHVDFDQSLHFCVRQIRVALGDTAARPRYVETLPRRGYRLLQPARVASKEVLEPRAASENPEPAPESAEGPVWLAAGVRLAVLVAAFLLLAVLAAAWLDGRSAGTSLARPVRLAIMPFELAGEGAERADLALISEWLLADLSRDGASELAVIGPRSTARYSAFPFPDIERMAEELSADFVINARFFDRGGERQLIVELIRSDDLSHPWADYFDDPSSWEEVAREVSARVRQVLAEARAAE